MQHAEMRKLLSNMIQEYERHRGDMFFSGDEIDFHFKLNAFTLPFIFSWIMLSESGK